MKLNLYLYYCPKFRDQLLHRATEILVGRRTQLVNQTRGLLAGHGITFPNGIGHLRKKLPPTLAWCQDSTAPERIKVLSEALANAAILEPDHKSVQDALAAFYHA